MQIPSELIGGLNVLEATPLSGGDIAHAYRLDTPDGPLFCKTHPSPTPALFEREAAGLRLLRSHAPSEVKIPEVLREHSSGLVLEWIEPGRRTRGSEPALGHGLAALHRVSHDHFGTMDESPSGHLGSMKVSKRPTTTWAEFFWEHRVRALTRRAVELHRLPSTALGLLDALEPRLDELCGPAEPPALLHGDLWAGNRMVDASGQNWLIDPAVHWGHREYDLAMMQLFGGFGDDCFRAYDEASPLADGWQQRVEWNQLVPLLVHAILFGGGYGDAVMSTLRRYR